jgi:predicted nicotinamide N-methyase
VVEVGCGLGLTAVAAALAGARSVWATDGDADLLVKTQDNLRRNARDLWDRGALCTRKLYWCA